MYLVYTGTYPYLVPKLTIMKLVCPECKNDIDLSPYPNLAKEHVIECNFCGITLQVMETSGDQVLAEVVDEGK